MGGFPLAEYSRCVSRTSAVAALLKATGGRSKTGNSELLHRGGYHLLSTGGSKSMVGVLQIRRTLNRRAFAGTLCPIWLYLRHPRNRCILLAEFFRAHESATLPHKSACEPYDGL
jgi:hypothetical protein